MSQVSQEGLKFRPGQPGGIKVSATTKDPSFDRDSQEGLKFHQGQPGGIKVPARAARRESSGQENQEGLKFRPRQPEPKVSIRTARRDPSFGQGRPEGLKFRPGPPGGIKVPAKGIGRWCLSNKVGQQSVKTLRSGVVVATALAQRIWRRAQGFIGNGPSWAAAAAQIGATDFREWQ